MRWMTWQKVQPGSTLELTYEPETSDLSVRAVISNETGMVDDININGTASISLTAASYWIIQVRALNSVAGIQSIKLLGVIKKPDGTNHGTRTWTFTLSASNSIPDECLATILMVS